MKKSQLIVSSLPEGGYTLIAKGARFNRIFLSCLLFLDSLFFTALLIVSGGRPGSSDLLILIVMEVFSVAGVVLGVLLLMAEDAPTVPWRIDAQGITLCRRWRNPTTLAWDDVKDWGFSSWGYVRYRGEAYRFYFSPHRMTSKNGAKSKIFPRKFTGYVMIVYPPDAIALRKSGLLSYCRARLDESETDARRYVPMFGSDIMEKAQPYERN